MEFQKLKVYISGALTGLNNIQELKKFYESIGTICQNTRLQVYVPHINTDPINNPDVTPQEVFETDKFQVSSSDLVIAYVGYSSLGVGMEIAYAEIKNIPVILLYEKDKTISRFPRGIPNKIGEIQFTNYEDALSQLRNILQDWHDNQKLINE